MKKIIMTFCLTISFALILTNVSLAVDLAIITGGKKGTYYQFGLNLKELVKPMNINLDVYDSTGSIENLYAVYQRPHTQMGIVQSDVLAFVTRLQSDPILKKIATKTKMIFPLYNEEIHLLGRRELNSFDDLTGKKVAIGQEGSGTYLTAKLLFEVSDVLPGETIPIGTDEALSQLKMGTIDAMFYVAGLPVKLFAEDVSEGDGLALIPISNERLTEFYPEAEIPAGTYKWQTQAVNTVAVKAVLVSFNFRRLNCENVGKFGQSLSENLDWLKENGHAKWRSVDLDFPLRGWERYDCVQKYLVKGKPNTPKSPAGINPNTPKSPAGINPIMEAVKEILNPQD